MEIYCTYRRARSTSKVAPATGTIEKDTKKWHIKKEWLGEQKGIIDERGEEIAGDDDNNARIERQTMKASGLPEDSVTAAWDFMVLPVS